LYAGTRCRESDGGEVASGMPLIAIEAPVSQLFAGVRENPAIHGNDEIGSFGLRDECARQEEPKARMRPPHERFETDDAPVAKPQNRLDEGARRNPLWPFFGRSEKAVTKGMRGTDSPG